MKYNLIIRYFAFSVSAFLLYSCSDEVESYTVEKQDLIESVYSSVTIEPKSLYTVKASNPGYIDQIAIEIGDTVELDQVLISIRDVQSRNTADNARLAFEMAQSNYKGEANYLEDMQLELKDALLKRKNDSINFARNKELYANGLITKVEFEQSELAFETSKTRCKRLENNIERSRKDLRSSMNQARNNYESSLSRFDDALVRSKIGGIVYEVFKESGEYISMQEPIALIGSRNQFIIKMRVDEVDITKVKLGQSIVVSLEAYKDKTFEAKVTRISPKLDLQTQTFEVEGEFVNSPEQLYMGLTGEGNIVVAERNGAVVIPLEYLIDQNHVQGENEKIKVVTGVRSLSAIEILSGLKEGDIILKPE